LTGLGQASNPHLFRDNAATTMAVADPGHVRLAAPLLGHRSTTTTERYYQQAQSLEGHREFQTVIDGVRTGRTRRGA
jgi:integrase